MRVPRRGAGQRGIDTLRAPASEGGKGSNSHTDEFPQSGVARVGEPAVGESAVQDQLPSEARAHGDQRKDMLILPQVGGEVGGEDTLRVLAQAQVPFSSVSSLPAFSSALVQEPGMITLSFSR